MVKRTLKEKEIREYLDGEGFKEVNISEKKTEWYKKASEASSCLNAVQKEKIKKQYKPFSPLFRGARGVSQLPSFSLASLPAIK